MVPAARRLATLLGRLLLPAPPKLEEQHRVARLQAQLIGYLQRLKAAEEQCRTCSGGGALTEALADTIGFELQRRPSGIQHPDAGDGVFLTAGGCPAGGILTLYPGLVHDMGDFVLLLGVSAPDDACAPAPPAWTLDNHYLLQLRCLNAACLVDGQPGGLSAQRFQAAAASWAAGQPEAALVNASWLALGGQQRAELDGRLGCEALLRQAALGHMLNHGPAAAANAAFDMCPLPAALPPSLQRYVPSLSVGGRGEEEVRWVPLVTARTALGATAGSPVELLVDYGINPLSLGFRPWM